MAAMEETQTEEIKDEEEEVSLLGSILWIIALLVAVFIFLSLAAFVGTWLAGFLGVSGGAVVARAAG